MTLTVPVSKNRVGEFFYDPSFCTWDSSGSDQCLQWENGVTTTAIASGANYYGFRYYSPDTGRWLNRDPIGEIGSNLLREIGTYNLSRIIENLKQFLGEHNDETISEMLKEVRNAKLTHDKRILDLISAMINKLDSYPPDPQNELALYVFSSNSAVNHYDILGLVPDCPKTACGLKNAKGSGGESGGGGGVKSGWCKDTKYPHKQDGKALDCYRSTGGVSGQQCCYDSNGNLAPGEMGTSPDKISPASGADKNGDCKFSFLRKAGHAIVDWLPSQF